ncbi:uncharacterized protein DFL_006902 [Arthrobotrys flagrans]|uniref:Uncharacterized protein n=1 Tax=Arthrobotrys flagrans TaxID=97331 RepID=A0A436ZUS1_ARTFL|nr:hypothetical protein DFL_006902 [Arthrobotrys flagrans]
MRSSIFVLATALAYVSAQGASGAPEPTVTAAPGTLPLGAQCATSEQCAGGAQCWASNAMLIRACGNFNAECQSDSQCAFNSCNNGLCNGLLSSSTTVAPTDAPGPSAPEPTVTAAPGTLPLGAECATSEQCAGGAECWASNVMLIRRCGNFNAGCTSDSQCAFNSCNNGLCNGFLSSSATVAPTDAPGPSGAPEPTVTAAPGTLPLGAQCATSEQCAGGAQCWASNAMLIRACGNFNAECESDAQCAFNTCNNGLCNGLKPSGSPTYGGNGTSTVPPTLIPTYGGNGTATVQPTVRPTYTGAANKKNVGVAGLIGAIAVAFAL